MSKAGQNTVTGISAQADISLLKLLENFHQSNFEVILLEDKSWEDFTLIFNDRIESYEVKWHAKPLSYFDVRSIIRKEVKKSQSDGYVFRILARSFSPQLKKDFEELKRILPYLGVSKGNRPFDRNPLVRKFIGTKKWKKEEVAFIARTELLSLGSSQQVSDQIFDLFRFQWEVFLSDADLKSLVSVCFKEVLEKAQIGSSISKSEFAALVSDFEEGLARKSESFTPTLSTATQTKNLAQFLTSPSEFKKLDDEKYLTPLTHRKNRALITYISKKLEANTFSTGDIEFFIEKVLLKSSFLYTCMHLLELKSNTGLMDSEYFIDFIGRNFRKLKSDYVTHDALKLLLSSLKAAPHKSPEVLKFLQNSIFLSNSSNKFLQRADLDYSYKFQHLPSVISVLGNELKHSEQFINILFSAFDFTGDHYQLPTDTPSEVYSILKTYLQKDPRRWGKLIKKFGAQFKQKYNLPFKGYEHSGGGVGMVGWSFSFTDTGLVRKLYAPFFAELLAHDRTEFFSFLKKNVFKGGTKVSFDNPVFLKRAAVAPLLEFLVHPACSPKEIEAVRSMLIQMVDIPYGIPSTRDALFAHLRSCDLKKIGHEFVLKLIIKDIQHTQYLVPSSIFVMETALKLLDEGYSPSKDVLVSLFKSSNFIKSWRAKEFLGALGNPNLLENNQALKFELIEAFDIKLYLDQGYSSDWLNSDFLKNHLRDLFKVDPVRARSFIQKLLSKRTPSERILNLLAGALFDVNLEFTEEIWSIFEAEIGDEKLFHLRFKKSSYFRQNFSRLAEAMLKNGKPEAAKRIIELLIRDPDPNTNANKQRHEELKRGASISTISGVRTQVPWILQKFAGKKDPDSLKYALKKLQVPLDLSGKLFKSLKYYDRDYYVMANAIVPLTELAHPYRRKVLRKAHPKKKDEVKELSLRILGFLKSEIDQKNLKLTDLYNYLVRVFFYIRDLNTSEAIRVLDFFELAEEEDSAPLVIYFALFRKEQYRAIPFDSKPFKKRLLRLCTEKNKISSKLPWHFWQTLKDGKLKAKKVKELDAYVEAFYRVSKPTDLAYLNYILEDALKSMTRYNRYFSLMKFVMNSEIASLTNDSVRDRYPKLHLRKIAGILRETNVADFFEVFEIIIAASDPKTGIGVYGPNLSSFIDEFQKIGDLPDALVEKRENIRRFLLGIGALE